ncbi:MULTISPECIES: bifunctional histidinol-phosphatase/imidazoleglycerol-phosphate dehydratase HisB [unclassified Siphonobacter]|uniref:bifunctional histidinol-phosphatase/imidazoleglycerol-phosphate dehydratase HisB n=1 Tax=unclassified Siphonobacter TaxID=2635712 RepID=UPI000CC965E2|nr:MULTISPECIES: bifunctional histidinol-phosphatase/imidazoleglycerol-phosphate dehydratase HisB [unclassified Siphonobacter]MDQ1086315.1 imidazoleglycerol-phosphate dehydratase/histidinol-phosphatase [Siphonobacter sp. SORGH_AS_1065]PKK35786.1 bifunctional imidazole glycerol-phosphate dehydratase/histidinol phosphatase [Siphonobacter sp. SORGH_AS_0500]
MKKALFIDRDGTIIVEPQTDFQIDSLEKLEFLPKAISALRKIAEETDYELVMVTNQDGLGTDSFPEDTFWPAQNKMLKTLEKEGVKFSAIHIDRSFPEQNLPTRKPGTGLLTQYLDGSYDLANSYVIGDRLTDVRLALNLEAKAILVEPDYKESERSLLTPELEAVVALATPDWDEIYRKVRLEDRIGRVQRDTKETQIFVELNLDGTGKANIETGLGFFDHMLDQLAKHGGLDLTIKVKGDLHIDEHHTIEDTALALGEAFRKALGDKRGIARYGFLLPMDEALAQVAIDFSGRPWLIWEADFRREKIGDMPTELFHHFFKSFTDTSLTNLNIKVEGDNEHHKIEAIFKAWAKAIKMAVRREVKELNNLPSTKGVL